MNEYFMQSELDYRRQQRLSAAAEHRRARSAVRMHTLRSRLTSAVEHVTARTRHARAA